MDGYPFRCRPCLVAALLLAAVRPCWSADPVACVAEAVLARHQAARVILVGERHREPGSHALFARLAEALADRGERVLVALEIPWDRGADLGAALGGADSPQFPVIDGPSYRELLARLGRLGDRGVSVAAVDASARDLEARDGAMARRIASALDSGRYDRVVALVGNLHALRTIPWAEQGGGAPREKLGALLSAGTLGVASVLQWFPDGCREGRVPRFHGAGSSPAQSAVEGLWNLLHTGPPEPGSAARAADAVVVWECAPAQS
ncbi:MAG: hypothetical protein AB1578_07450 [Thermodesulfobacteriota bacterium]